MKKLLSSLLFVAFLFVGCDDIPYSPNETNNPSIGLSKITGVGVPEVDGLNAKYTNTFSVNGIKDETMKFDYEFSNGQSFEAELKVKKGTNAGDYTIVFDTKNLSVEITSDNGCYFNIPPKLKLKFSGILADPKQINFNDPKFYDHLYIVPGSDASLSNNNTTIKVKGAQIGVGLYGFTPMDANHYNRHLAIDGIKGKKLSYKYTYPDGTKMKATLNFKKGVFAGVKNFDIDFSVLDLSFKINPSEGETEPVFNIPMELTLQFENPIHSYQAINKHDPHFYKIMYDYNSIYRKLKPVSIQKVDFNEDNNKFVVQEAPIDVCGDYGFQMNSLDYMYQFSSQLTILNSKGGNVNFKYTYPDGTVLQAKLKIAKGAFTPMGKEKVTFWIDFDPVSTQIIFSPHGSNFTTGSVLLDVKFDMSKSTNNLPEIFYADPESVNFQNIGEDNVVLPVKKITVDLKKRKLEVKEAQVPHFSRYGWVR